MNPADKADLEVSSPVQAPPVEHAETGAAPLWARFAPLVAFALVVAAALPLWSAYSQKSRADALADEGLRLLEALLDFEQESGIPPRPGAGERDGFNLRTLEPLAGAGFIGNPDEVLARLEGRRISAYDAPGLEGGEGFWAILQDLENPGIQVVVASTDSFPLAPDTWIEGVYLLRGDELERVRVASAPRTKR